MTLCGGIQSPAKSFFSVFVFVVFVVSDFGGFDSGTGGCGILAVVGSQLLIPEDSGMLLIVTYPGISASLSFITSRFVEDFG